MKRVAVLGLGAMGLRMAQNLLAANYPVTVYNRTPEKAKALLEQGAVYAPTPREAAEQADVVISMVTDDGASRAVWLTPETGAVLGLKTGKIAIASSTLTVGWTKELGIAIQNHGVAFLDAPVVGSRPQAEAGKLIYLVGGKAETLAKVQDILHISGTAVHHVGGMGQGMAMKLAVNALFGIQVVALAEVTGMLTRQGIATAKALDCLGELPITSPAAKGIAGLIAADKHAPLFPIELVEKDFRYAVDAAKTVAAVAPVCTAIGNVYRDAIANGYGQENITGVAHLFL